MKKLTVILVAVSMGFNIAAQAQKLRGKISTVDTADLSILNVYPDSFPDVSVVFKAETRKGEPVWNLTREKMKVAENSQECKVVSLEQISRNKPIILGVVIDHSGSMNFDPSQLFDKKGNPIYMYDAYFNLVPPRGYVTPIDNAKKAVKNFVASFNVKKDFISIVGFSSIIDRKLALSQDVNRINAVVDSMEADNSTALYDAMLTAIDEIKSADGLKVLVVLTDGQNNSSQASCKDVINKAIAEDIPIYTIGLGDASKDTLQLIANTTKGQFYFTQSSASLNALYAGISKKVQAFYNLVYTSPNFASADSSRQIELSFDVDSIYLLTNPVSLKLPKEVVAFITKKEKQKEFLVYGGIASVTLVSAGVLLLIFKRKRKKQSII